jgi:two-component system, chemotaxis family, sensor kinase Cph1
VKRLKPEAQISLPDLTTCEREPIHIPGAIEPHGALLALSEPDLVIRQVSANTLPLIGLAPESLIGMKLGEVFAPDEVTRLTSGGLSEGNRQYVSSLAVANEQTFLDGLVHRHGGVLIIELEPRETPSNALSNSEIYTSFTDAMAELAEPLALSELCQRIAGRIRRITGFDRVMVYRFHEDDSGSVIAEDLRQDLVPYLGLRYPASDIPAQARRLYLLNTLRLKPDVDAPRVGLIPPVNPSTGGELDMTFCILRAMSPVHVEYLRNMGVTASMSISIVKQGRLWGLIACHHCRPKLVLHPLRITCEVLARVFSSHIAAAEEQDKRAQADTLRDLTNHVRTRLRHHDAATILAEEGERIATANRADGAAFCTRGKFALQGRTPAREQVEGLLGWLKSNQQEQTFATGHLSAQYPEAAEFKDRASGLLSIRIAPGSSDFILWFRPAVTHVVNWAGDPAKPVNASEAGQRISPRRSFDLWKQISHNSSEPWEDTVCEFASALRQLVAEALLRQMNDEVHRLNLELSRSNVELDSFAYAASHDLQEPVRMIRSYAQLLARRADPELRPELREFIKIIENSASRMSSLISGLLSYSQLGGTERRKENPVNLEDVLRWVLMNLDQSVRESGATVTHDVLPTVTGDQDQLVQLLQNLIGNAIKYRKMNERPVIHLAARAEGDSWCVSVRDNGQGFDPEQADSIFGAFKRLHGRDVPGSGIGLATCKRIVELHGGRIWAESSGEGHGATFWFTLPRPGV